LKSVNGEREAIQLVVDLKGAQAKGEGERTFFLKSSLQNDLFNRDDG
jgi:hypothetical protein